LYITTFVILFGITKRDTIFITVETFLAVDAVPKIVKYVLLTLNVRLSLFYYVKITRSYLNRVRYKLHLYNPTLNVLYVTTDLMESTDEEHKEIVIGYVILL
jgi:hypothetical protein